MTEERARHLGTYIRQLRTRKKLGVRELARQAGIDAALIVRLESGAARHPRLDTFTSMARALGVPLIDMLAESGQIEPCGAPCIGTHLRLCYSHLLESAIREIEAYTNQIVGRAA